MPHDTSRCFIDGEWIAPLGGRTLPVIDPSTNDLICDIARGEAADIDAAVAAATGALATHPEVRHTSTVDAVFEGAL